MAVTSRPPPERHEHPRRNPALGPLSKRFVRRSSQEQNCLEVEPFRLRTIHGVRLVQCDLLLLHDALRHGLTTRRDDVLAAPELAGYVAGLPGARVVRAEQVHGRHVAEVGSADPVAYGSPDCVADTDALITRDRRVLLVLTFADCVPIFFYDVATPAIGLAHAGWRGTAEGIAANTVAAMVNAFGTRPEACLAALGPAIGPCCYEVRSDVADAISASCREAQVVRRCEDGRIFADLRACNAMQLLTAGIRPESLRVSSWCTACNVDLFFSHRAEGARAGRMAAFMALA